LGGVGVFGVGFFGIYYAFSFPEKVPERDIFEQYQGELHIFQRYFYGLSHNNGREV